MCLVVVGWRCHAHFPLVVAANRDEFHDRPTAPATFWSDHPTVFAGRDLLGGGTWMGASRAGRFAALTNYRDPALHRTHAPSRGALVSGFLAGVETPEQFAARLEHRVADYNGFNLLVADLDALICISHVPGEPYCTQVLSPGVHALSNHRLNTPWPKLLRARAGMTRALPLLPDRRALRRMLADRDMAPDSALPDTGVGLALERMLSAVFIVSPRYGTRASTLLLRSNSGELVMEEAAFDSRGRTSGWRSASFCIAP